MRNAMSKDFFREIKYTFNRYVSILLIVALGVAFLAGIRATCPDMKLSLDYYLDQSDFMDLRVLSTLGLTDDDLQAISSIEGVKAVEGAYSYDAEVIGENAKWILRFLSEPQNVNKISLVEGRDIENPDECIVDRLMIDKDGYQIGDQLTVTAAGKDENVSDALSVTTFTIVGAAASPSYFTSARDTTSIGTGQTDAFVYLSPEVFKSEAYSAAYLTVEGAAEKTAYSDAYDNVVDQVKNKLEAISEEREAARYNGIMDDANTELDDARSKLADAKADAESELSDAWAKLQDGEQQIRDGQKTLDDNKAAYEEQITSAKAKLQNSEQQLQKGEAQVSANEKKLKDGRQQLSEARQQLEESGRTLEAKKQQYEEGLKAAEDGQKQLDEGRAQLAAASESLKSQEEALNTQKNALQEQYETLLVQKEELNEGIIQLERQIGELCQQRDTHGADRSHSGWAGTADCTIEQARDNNCDWKTRWEIAEEIGKDIEQATGQSAFRHNAGREHKQRHRQKHIGIHTVCHGLHKVDRIAGKGRIKEVYGQRRPTDRSGDWNADTKKNKENAKHDSSDHLSTPPSTVSVAGRFKI